MLQLQSHASRLASGSAACATRTAAPRSALACRATRRDTGADVTPLPDTTSALSRRDFLAASIASSLLVASSPASALQGYTAGRIPGVSVDPDEEGFYTYTRPEGKQGGHGVGWSEIPQYSFKIPSGWEEVPVSIADLGGTEIDLRFQSKEEGSLQVVVAPVLRFADVGFNANVRIEKLAPPENIIAGFGPELFGAPIVEEDVEKTEVRARAGLTYYHWEVKPRRLVTATATGNRVFLMAVTANPRQWRKHEDILREISLSFTVPPVNNA